MSDTEAHPKVRLRLLSFSEQTFTSACLISIVYGLCLIIPLALKSWTYVDTEFLVKDFLKGIVAASGAVLVSVAIGGFMAIPFSICPGIPVLFYQIKYNKMSPSHFFLGGMIAGIIVGLLFFAFGRKPEISTIAFWIMTGIFINLITYYRCYRPSVLEKTLAKIKRAA